MNNFNSVASREWRAIQFIAVITALYITVFMLKMGEPDQFWWWLLALVFFVWLYSPFLILIGYSLRHKENIPALRVVFIAMLINLLGGFYLSYQAFEVSKTDAGGAMFFGILPMFQIVISGIGLIIAERRAA